MTDIFALSHAIMRAYKRNYIVIDFNGHFRNGSIIDKPRLEREMGLLLCLGSNLGAEDRLKLLKAIEKEEPADRLFDMGEAIGLYDCECGEPMRLRFDGKTLRCDARCRFPDGIPPFEFELDVPSGLMVVANDLRDGFRVNECYNVHRTIGVYKTAMRYAQVGLAHAFVGSSRPTVWKRDDAHFVIGSGNRGSPEYPIRVVGIRIRRRTHLSWYSACDLRLFEKSCAEQRGVDFVPCKPGVYRFVHHHHLLPDPSADGAVYVTIEWQKPLT